MMKINLVQIKKKIYRINFNIITTIDCELKFHCHFHQNFKFCQKMLNDHNIFFIILKTFIIIAFISLYYFIFKLFLNNA